jgi:hypothetical protein
MDSDLIICILLGFALLVAFPWPSFGNLLRHFHQPSLSSRWRRRE